jgi:hypothetical protein
MSPRTSTWREITVHAPRVGRPAIALLVAMLALAISSAAHAATPCSWKGQSPCLAKRSQSWFVWGALTAANTGTDVSINVKGFGRLSKKIDHALDDEVGNDDVIRTVASTRFLVVDSHKHKARVGADVFWATIDAYDSPTVYVTGRLAAGAYWGDDPTNLVASSIVVDLSDLGAVGPDLSGSWLLNGAPATLTPADDSNTTYNGTSGGALFTLTVSGGTRACITAYAYAPVPNNATTFTCGSVSSNLATIGPLIWTSPVWGSGTWTFTR